MSDRHRILVADDELHSLTILRDFLDARGYEVVTAMDGQEALERFQSDGPFDLVLLDVMMPGMNGWEVCRAVKRTEAGESTPVLMVSALGQPEHLERGKAEGADDYVVKPVRFLDLDARVHAMLGARKDRQGGAYREKVVPATTSEVMSPIDPLTGLFNRHYFDERLDREFHRASAHRGQIALLLIQTDDRNLKAGNRDDDLVLCQVARAIGDAILPRDVACRLDGSRFAVIACGAKPREAVRLAEMIRWGVERATRMGEGRESITSSVGLAHRQDLGDPVPKELLIFAERALEKALATGKNQVVNAQDMAED